MSFQELAQKAFAIDVVRDMILSYVVLDKNKKVSYSSVRSCRLISKAWMHSISRCLRKCREPLFQIFLRQRNSISSFVGENEKLLDKFTYTVTGTSRLENQIPTFKIRTTADFFHQENHTSLLECFSQCGSGLVELDIEFPENGGSLIFPFPDVRFPKLKTFRIAFTNSHIELNELAGSSNAVCLMNLVLSECNDLQTLVLKDMLEDVPYGIDGLVLPPTLTKLELYGHLLEKEHFELLVRNDLPNLKKLTLPIGAYHYLLKGGLISQVLENVKTRLVHLVIDGIDNDGEEISRPTYFKLPVLEHLKHFQTDSIHLELEDGISMLQNCLPKLEKLSLESQIVPMFQKWTNSSKYDSVKELTVSLVEERFNEDENEFETFYISFPSTMMRLVEMAFPNIQTLEITVCGTRLCGLKYAFGNLKKLQILRVTAKGCEVIQNSDCWDTLLIGTPVKCGTALRSTGEEHPSIKNLTELQELLLSASFGLRTPRQLTDSLISDVAFNCAFLEMPKLKKLRLRGIL